MIQISTFPHILAALNALTLILLIAGRILIKNGNRQAHKKAMISALAVSVVFLTFYIIYHANSGLARFGGHGIIRPIYFTILLIHVIGAAAIVPLVPLAVWRAAKGEIERHKKIVRITWPLWAFTAASGVVVYFLAVRLYPYA
ncbi:DUF420 domain-containing protein [Varunaivibrio sulfuroxidans]|uniref:Putative membrane protein n=1 Tax=Varunaivibrio sulfuroxidans TaxID=1773489 RepID=A0A4R3JAP4_9PROT|nr:DUF420 domain-containing protein [Varunaivibrio sulfuroxidans]TCS62647.1 putative membrane protein [Varunaivibrio sulfuroxidans]WES30687.1 DUF420 domain-containing protein [Varunaivibrio sulfuroxidans]